jgi:hypothetical protein
MRRARTVGVLHREHGWRRVYEALVAHTCDQCRRTIHPGELFTYRVHKAPICRTCAHAEPGWCYRVLATGHDAMLTVPRDVADVLDALSSGRQR